MGDDAIMVFTVGLHLFAYSGAGTRRAGKANRPGAPMAIKPFQAPPWVAGVLIPATGGQS
jgi:hypothetical protein